MRLRPPALLLGLGLALASFSPAPVPPPSRPDPDRVAADPARLAAEEQALQSAARADDAAAALDYFRKRTPNETQRRTLRDLVAQLADDSFEVRNKASAALTASGPVAAAPLRAAARSPDEEAARRARACLAEVRREQAAPVVLSGVKLVVRRRPADAVAVLFDYLPFAEDEGVAEEIRASLAALTKRDGKPEPALLGALECDEPDRRAEAGVILARADLAETRDAVRRLLKDESASVRLRVGRALVEAKDRDAVPVLVELLGDLAGEDRWELVDLLERLAGENAPALPRDDSEATRRRRLAAWRAWWQVHGDRVDFAGLAATARPADRTLLLSADLSSGDGELIEVDAEGKTLRRLGRLRGPVAVQAASADSVLVAEYTGKRIAEYSYSGILLWHKELPGNPVAVQRLPGGHTFVACRNRLLEYDHDGKEVANVPRPVRDILGARRHSDGTTILLTHDGRCRWLDAAGKETHSFPVPGPHVMGAGIDLTRNKCVLVPNFGQDRVTEYDAEGRLLWEVAAPGPVSAERLPDGHTLIGCTPPRVIELDRVGQVVWQYEPGRPIVQATRRGRE
jgi:HEAT repeat protein